MAAGHGKDKALVVQSKLKNLIKKNKMKCASDVAAGVNRLIEAEVQRAVQRAKANGRKTLRASDL